MSQKFNHIEDLLLNHRNSIGIHNGVPFIMLIYNPEEEMDCRVKTNNLEDKLKSNGLSVLTIPMNKFIFNQLENKDLLEDVLKYDQMYPKEVRSELKRICTRNLKPFILNQIKNKNPDVVFITRVSSLHPYYRVSNIFTSLEDSLDVVPPFLVFYPGKTIDDKLYFLGEFRSSEYYRAQRI